MYIYIYTYIYTYAIIQVILYLKAIIIIYIPTLNLYI